MRSLEAIQQSIQDRTHALKYQVTPEEQQLLGITPEDLASFSDESLMHTPAEIMAAVEEIIMEAYKTSPGFKKIFEEDMADDPSMMAETSQVVAGLLDHLGSVLPPEHRAAIKTDTYGQAQEIIRDVLHKQRTPQAPAPVEEEKIGPISPEELSFFNLKPEQLTAKTRWDDLKNYVLYFLGKLKNEAGKTIKNEATSKMPDEMKITILSKLLNDIRTKKLQSGQKLLPKDLQLFGKNLNQLKQIARSMVVRAPGKDEPVYVNDLMEVNSKTGEVLTLIERITDVFKDPKLGEIIGKMTDVIDQALPPVNYFQNKLEYIKDELSALGLKKSQAAALMDVNTEALTYGEPLKKALEDQQIALSDVTKQLKTKPDDGGLLLKKKNIEAQIGQINDLKGKDITALKKAVEGYLDMLREFKEKIKTSLTTKGLEDMSILKEFIGLVNDLALKFGSLSKENMFKARWAGRSGYMVKNLSPESSPPVSKEAADTVSGYTRRLNKFRGKGLVDSYQQIDDIITGDGGLPAVRGKLIRILNFADRKPEVDALLTSGKDIEEIKSDIISLIGGRQYGKQLAEILSKHTDPGKIRQIVYRIMEKDPRQYSDVSTEEIDLDVAIKMINRLRTLTKQLNFGEKGSEALEVLSWMADLGQHFKAPKKKPTSEKIKKLAMIMLAADGEPPKGIGVQSPEGPRTYGPKGFSENPDKYQNPAGVGSDLPYPTTSKAQPILFRSRQTKMGKKSLQSVFAEPTFVPVLIEEMEKAGLSKGLLEGGKMPPVDIDKILEAVLQKVTGKEGTLENILDSNVMQAYKAEGYDLPRVQKDLDEAIARRKELNDKINQVEQQYIPRLTSFALFIENPIAAVQEKMKKGLTGEPEEKKKDEDVLWMKEEIKPHTITSENFQKVLSDLSFRYSVQMPEVPKSKKAATDTAERPTRTVKKFVHSDLSKKMPTDFFKQYQIWKKILKDLKRGVDSKKDAYQRSVALEKYYSYMMMVIKNLKGFFGYQDDTMAADRQTIENLESFLRSGESRNVVDKERAAARIKALKKAFMVQEQMYHTIKKEHPKLDVVERITTDSLTEVRDDIKTKDIETLRGIAVSPELHPSKEKAREIKEKAREHEKGLSYIIDRSTYKNNMNKIMTYKPKREKIEEWFSKPSNMTFLPPERKKVLDEAVQKGEELKKRLQAKLDYEHKKVALTALEEELKKVQGVKKEVDERILTFDEALSRIPWHEMIQNYAYDAEKVKGGVSADLLNQFMERKKLLDARVPKSFKDIKDMKDKVEKAKRLAEEQKSEATSALEEIKKLYEQEVAELKEQPIPEQKIDPGVLNRIKELESRIDAQKKELEQMTPPEETKIKIQNLYQMLLRVRDMEKDSVLKPRTLQQKVGILEEKLRILEEIKSINFKVNPGTEEQQMLRKFLAELEHITLYSRRELENAKEQLSKSTPISKTAAIEDRDPDLSPYERALEERGKEPPPFIKEIKKPKGWEIVEDFFHNVKREHKFLADESKKKGTPIRTDFLERRLSQLKQMAKAIDSYKKQLIHIDWKAPDPENPDKMIDYKQLVPFEETMNKFEELLFEYQDLVRKFTNQRNDTEKRISDLQQHVQDLKGLFDEEGKFKGMSPEKLKSLKNIFLRMLYRDLESYWASNVGQQLSVFGERATDWYNNVYHTFKEVAKSRSNKKMLGMINKFKKETRSEMDDIVHRTKAQELEDERDELVKTLTEMGIDPEKSPRLSERLKTLNTRIETIRKQEKQIDQVFNFMGAASIVSMQADFEEMLRKKIKKLDNEVKQEMAAKGKEPEDYQKDEELAIQDVDLNDEAQQEVDKAIDQVEKSLPVLVENKKDVDEAEQIISAMREERGEPEITKKPEGPVKVAYDKNHRDFNLNILYGSFMQNIIASMIAEEIK